MIVVSCFIVCKHSCTSSFFLIKKCLLKCPVQYFLCFYCPFNLVLVIIFWFFVSNLHKKLFAFAWRFFFSGVGMSVHTAPPHCSVCSRRLISSCHREVVIPPWCLIKGDKEEERSDFGRCGFIRHGRFSCHSQENKAKEKAACG